MSMSSNLTNDQIQELLDHYFNSDAFDLNHRRSEIEYIQRELLNIQTLETLSDAEIVERMFKFYRENIHPPMYGRYLTEDRIDMREALTYLISSDDEIESKVNAFLDKGEKYHIVGINKAYWSLFFMALDPDNNPNWNNKTEKALKAIGMAYWTSEDSPGQRYRQIAKAEKTLVNLSNDPRANLFTIDHFMHFIVVEEGKDILESWHKKISTPKKEEDDKQLAEPLGSIFNDTEEAQWALDLIKETLNRLSVYTPEDERFALTLPKNRSKLRLNYGNWLVLGFNGSFNDEPLTVDLALKDDLIDEDWTTERGSFTQPEDEPKISLAYAIPASELISWDKDLRTAYEETFDLIAERFQHWNRCIWRKNHHIDQLADAVFDASKRPKLVNEGITVSPVTTDDDEIERPETNPEYSLAECAFQTGFNLDELSRWVRAINRKKQAIIYGPPGTGKTFLAEHLARHLVGGGDGFWEVVQFHPAYSYEDFIQGIRPQSREDGGLSYPMVPGRFLVYCKKAGKSKDTCVLIIDEINRANLARVFGELMYLLEYRDREIPLAGGDQLTIPKNVRIIGTMNTADRSIALVDHALRRRFAFLALYPNYDLLRTYHQKHATGFSTQGLIKILERLNRQIGDRHYEIGVSFFLREDLPEQIGDIWRMEIEPYLEEYFFDQPDKVNDFRWDRVTEEILP